MRGPRGEDVMRAWAWESVRGEPVGLLANLVYSNGMYKILRGILIRRAWGVEVMRGSGC
jgi:hypothetical protein